jgi:hypothetical protein
LLLGFVHIALVLRLLDPTTGGRTGLLEVLHDGDNAATFGTTPAVIDSGDLPEMLRRQLPALSGSVLALLAEGPEIVGRLEELQPTGLVLSMAAYATASSRNAATGAL